MKTTQNRMSKRCEGRAFRGTHAGTLMFFLTVVIQDFGVSMNQESIRYVDTAAHRAKGDTYRPEVMSDPCIREYGGVELNYTLGSSMTFQFDLCDVIDCGSDDMAWRGYDVYLCHFKWGAPYGGQWCPRWSYVGWNTRPGGYTAPQTGKLQQMQEHNIGLLRARLTTWSGHGSNMKVNPLLLTVTGLQENAYYCGSNPLNNCQKRGDKGFYLILGVEVAGVDPKGLVRFNLLDPPRVKTSRLRPKQKGSVRAYDTGKISYPDQLKIETGYSQVNTWLALVQDAAHQAQKGNCIVCAQARPNLVLAESAFEYTKNGSRRTSNSSDINCLLQVMSHDNLRDECAGWDKIYPVAPQNTAPPVFQPTMLTKVTCFNNANTASGRVDVGRLSSEFCVRTYDLTGKAVASRLVVNRADVWWYCGGKVLWGWLPVNWKGRCAVVSLLSPIQVIPEADWPHPSGGIFKNHVSRRSIDPYADSPVWIDAIGIPRGVPDEYKLANQVAAGFESIFLWVTPNKNVDRINYVHYNVQRLSNYTRDGFEAVHGQLSATSLVSYQNRLALDMVLAKEGGVCSIIGDSCCSYIPENTSPDGSLTKALKGLRSLSVELKSHSGIDEPLSNMFHSWFGKWGNLLVSIFSSTVVVAAVIAVCACCCAPCIRVLILRLIGGAISSLDGSKRGETTTYQMPLAHVSTPILKEYEQEEQMIRLMRTEEADV